MLTFNKLIRRIYLNGLILHLINFFNTDATFANVFKRYEMKVNCYLKKGSDVVNEKDERLTLADNVNVTTIELDVILEKNSIKNGAWGKIVNDTSYIEDLDINKTKKKFYLIKWQITLFIN